MRQFLSAIVIATVILQSTACGLLLYPEREGQTGGRIDPGVAVLDAAGLLLFIVPGLIAFGVDFVTGTIYLPGTEQANRSPGVVREVKLAGAVLNEPQIEQIVAARTGHRIDISAPETRIIALGSEDELRTSLNTLPY